MLKKISFPFRSVISIFVVLVNLSGGLVFAVIQDVPQDGTGLTISENAVKEASKTTKAYSYADGDVFDRWVYSSWLKTDFSAGRQAITSVSKDQPIGLLSFNTSVSTKNLEAGWDYQLSLDALFECGSIEAAKQGNCTLYYQIRCYDYVDEIWQKTFDAVRSKSVTKDGHYAISELIDLVRCSQSVEISFRGNVREYGVSYAFRNLTLGFAPVKD